MIIKKFRFEQKDTYIGISQIYPKSERIYTEDIVQISENLQQKYRDFFIQLFNAKYVLNTTHIFYAYYYMLKAFHYNKNISNKPNIEFLLYLATNRQISVALKDFGISSEQIKTGHIHLCMISPKKKSKYFKS